jgi:hypothetical protein
MTKVPVPLHHGHDIAFIDGRTYCEDCHVDLTDKEVCAIERHDKFAAFAELREGARAVSDTINFLIQEGIIPALTPNNGMSVELALHTVREAIVSQRKAEVAKVDRAAQEKTWQRKLRAERIYERLVVGMVNRGGLTAAMGESGEEYLGNLRQAALRAAAVWEADD